MLHDSLSLGPTLRSGLPPDGRHHFAALMRERERSFEEVKNPRYDSSESFVK